MVEGERRLVLCVCGEGRDVCIWHGSEKKGRTRFSGYKSLVINISQGLLLTDNPR